MKRGRGRPKTNGFKPGWMLIRSLVMIERCMFFRLKEKMTLNEAISATVKHIKETYGMPASPTAVKNALSEFHSEERDMVGYVVANGDRLEFKYQVRPVYTKRGHQRIRKYFDYRKNY